MGIVSERVRESIDWRDDEVERCCAGERLRGDRTMAKRGNERERMRGSREACQRAERIPGVGHRQKRDTEIGSASCFSRWSPQMQQGQRHRCDGRCGHELALAAVRATQALVLVDAAHEGFNRLHHDRIGRRRIQCRARGGEARGLVRRTDQPVVANALEALGQHVQQETIDEDLCRHNERALAIGVGRIAHAYAHRVCADVQDALVGDRHPMRIAAQIVEHLRRAAQRLFGIEHPIMPID